MNFLGMGPAELILIFIIALIVFGPGKLPELGQAIGKSLKDFRKMSQEFTKQVNLEAMTAELEEKEKVKQKPAEPKETPQANPAAGIKTEALEGREQEEQDTQEATESMAEETEAEDPAGREQEEQDTQEAAENTAEGA
jgi:sec-independent protein translocase protein TatA